MAIKYPDIIEHNNPNFPLVDITSLKGVAYPLSSISLTGSIPTAKRNPGIIVFDTTAQEFYGFKAADSSSLSWDNPSSWSTLDTGGQFITGSGTATQIALFSGSLGQNSTEIFSTSSLTYDNQLKILGTANISASGYIHTMGSITSSNMLITKPYDAAITESLFLIKMNDGNGQSEKFNVQNDGVIKFAALNTLPTAITGGVVYSASNFYMGL
jgi:hypothetical protein|tara:strand:- start:123 stop:761 length:639 start_codon:yes stop_codon:yes gene_type:complete